MYQRAARASHGADRGHVRRNAVAAVRATCHGTWCAQHVVISTVVRSENLGALNLHGDAAGVFTDESLFVGGVLAQHAAVAMVGAAEVSQLHAALVSRDIIGQAKGILMHRDNLTGLQAFEALTRASQTTQVKGLCRVSA